MCENSDLEKFIFKRYAPNKHKRKYQENGHFDVKVLKNSKKFQINKNKNDIFSNLKMLLLNHFHHWERKLCILHLRKGGTH